MLKRISVVLMLLFLCLCGNLFPQKNVVPLKAIGRIFLSLSDTTCIGTAFVAGKSKAIYTCSHVVQKDTLWFMGFKSKDKHKIAVKYNLPKFDIAFLKRTKGLQNESLEFGNFDRIQPGDKIIYIGWDNVKKLYMINTALVSAKGSALMNSDCKVNFIEFKGNAIPGYSGGPVFDMTGKVIGIIREAWNKKGIKGGKTFRINRAFSVELLRILDSEIITSSIDLQNNKIVSLYKLFAK